MKKKLVIIGGGGAGLFAGATVMQLSKKFEVFMISDEELFCRCSTPYVINKRANFKDTIMPDSMITQFGIKLIKTHIENINSKLKYVEFVLDGKKLKLKYDTLMFATGARSFVPKIEGIELTNVFSVRSANDLKKINQKTQNAKSAVVVGGGVIGVEMACALRERGLQVTLLILEDKPFERIADIEFSEMILETLKKNKIKVISNSKFKKISGKSKVESIVYEINGKENTLKTEMVVMATGVRANKDMAEKIGVKCTKQGIIVDDFMRTNIKGVYAAGDVVVSKNFVTNIKTPSQLATNAVIQGKIAGKNIAGMKTKFVGHTSAMMVQFLGEEFGSCGLTEKDAIENKIAYYIGTSDTTDIYQDLKGAHSVHVKLIFNKKTNRIIGMQGYGKNLIWVVNLISYAIINKSKITDLMNLDYASHPSVSPWPFMDPVVDACEKAFFSIGKK